ncbi:hypothetical protein [Streptomyces sp. NBC_01314]|uniref:hypothetical protein n=1 Tax=Streptomyces sp. NBC_01314 TaxID=2903821 RepID=UPI00308C29A3|nr:hypothetical protein OG622_30060 [Streptomyces sp. NBC_01314]
MTLCSLAAAAKGPPGFASLWLPVVEEIIGPGALCVRHPPSGRTRTTGWCFLMAGERKTNEAGSSNGLRGDVLCVLGVLKIASADQIQRPTPRTCPTGTR